MGFFSDLVDVFTSKDDSLKFYKDGVCLPDNTIVPWTDVKNIEDDDDIDDSGFPYIEFIGGITLGGTLVKGVSNDDSRAIGVKAGKQLWRNRTHNADRSPFPDQKTFAAMTGEEQVSTLKLAYSEILRGFCQ